MRKGTSLNLGQATISRRVRRGVHWVHVHPSPPGKKFRSEMSIRGEKVTPRYVGKKERARSEQIQQN